MSKIKNIIIGKTGLNEVFILNQEERIAISSYYVIEDEINGNLIGEVIETNSIPKLTEKYLNDIGSDISICKDCNFEINKITHIAKLKILNDTFYPITPLSNVREANFEEIKPFICKTNVSNGFNLGIIKGTELLQNQLPDELKNISPLWKNGVAIHQEGIPFIFNFNALREYPHIFISGGSGSGKSFAYRVIMEEAMKYCLPGIVFDIHNEFTFETPMKGLNFTPNFNHKYEIFEVGKDIGIDFNTIKISELITLFSHKEPLTDAQRRILEIIYEDGMSLGEFEHKLNVLTSAFSYMSGFRAKESDIDNPEEAECYAKYKKLIASPDTLRSILSKFTVIKESGVFGKDITKVKMCLKSNKLAIIRGNIEILKMITGFMINRFYNERRYYVDNNVHNPNDPSFFPPFFVYLDEAHNFAPKETFNPLKTLLRKLGQEARKYGVFLVLCTQGPCLLDKTLLDQINTKVVLRTGDVVNKDIAKNELNLTNIQYEMLNNLPSGTGFISSPIFNKTFHIQFRTSFTMQPKAEGVFDELKAFNENKRNENETQNIILSFITKEGEINFRNKASLLAKLNDKNIKLDMNNLSDILEQMADSKILEKFKSPMGIFYKLH